MRGKEHGRSRKNASGHIITTPEVVAEDGSRRKGSGTAEDKATMVREYEKPLTLETLGIKRAPQSWQYVR